MTRRILKEFELSRIAAVDRPCQEHAKMTIMKRADTAALERHEFPAKYGKMTDLSERIAKQLTDDFAKSWDGLHACLRDCKATEELGKALKEAWEGWDVPPTAFAVASLFLKYVEERHPDAIEQIEKALSVHEKVIDLRTRAEELGKRLKNRSGNPDLWHQGKHITTVPNTRGLSKRIQVLKGLINLSKAKDALGHGSDARGGGGVPSGGSGKYGYKAFWRGKTMDVRHDTTYGAQQLAAQRFGAKKAYEVNVMLAEKDGKPVTHLPLF